MVFSNQEKQILIEALNQLKYNIAREKIHQIRGVLYSCSNEDDITKQKTILELIYKISCGDNL